MEAGVSCGDGGRGGLMKGPCVGHGQPQVPRLHAASLISCCIWIWPKSAAM